MIVVAGAGITGLTLAHELRKGGEAVRLLEARRRPGGMLWSEEDDGVWLDLGPQRTRLTGDVEALVREAGLEEEIVEAPADLPLFIYREGRLRRVPFSAGDALRTDLLSWHGKLRVLLEPLTSPPFPRETVAEYFERKFGSEAYENLLGPLYGGLYASDPARMPVRHALGNALEEHGVGRSLLLYLLRRGRSARADIPSISFREGLGALSRALADGLGDSLRLDAPVRSVVQGPSDRLQVEAEKTQPLEARALVLTCPADAAAAVLKEAVPSTARKLESLTYNQLAVVHLRAECDLTGYGYQVAFGEELETRGVTWNASIFGRDGIYTAYLGGMKQPRVVERADDVLAGQAAREFEVVTGCEARPVRVSRTRIPAWDRSWNALDDLGLPPRVHLCASYTGRPGIPGRVRAAKALARELLE